MHSIFVVLDGWWMICLLWKRTLVSNFFRFFFNSFSCANETMATDLGLAFFGGGGSREGCFSKIVCTCRYGSENLTVRRYGGNFLFFSIIFFNWRQILIVNWWSSHFRKVLSCLCVLRTSWCANVHSQFWPFCVQVASMTLQALILFVLIETLPTYVTCANGECLQNLSLHCFRIRAQPAPFCEHD